MRKPLLFVVVFAVACGGSSASVPSDSPNNSPTGGQSSGSSGGGSSSGGSGSGSSSGSSSSGGSSSGGGGDGGSAVPPGPPAGGTATFGTYIVLGDSISDKGGEPPYFYDLLFKNDDTTYPTFKGHDLSTKYPGIQEVHAAIAGSVTDLYADEQGQNIPTLASQIKGLGTSYPGDVLITITIGGNDLNYHAYDAATGNDANDKAQLTTFLDTALTELTTPGRLGSGKVTILEANIYDASDGKGNWQSGGPSGGHCGPNLDVGQTVDTNGFTAWNGIIAQAIAKATGDHPLDLHALFAGHGFNSNDMWYAGDCIHPNKKGHGMLRAAMWQLLTGETP